MRSFTTTLYDYEDYKNVRDDMTDEEAAKTIEKIQRGYLPDYSCDGTENDFDNYRMHVALDKAMGALKRYAPK